MRLTDNNLILHVNRDATVYFPVYIASKAGHSQVILHLKQDVRK